MTAPASAGEESPDFCRGTAPGEAQVKPGRGDPTESATETYLPRKGEG